MRPVAILWFVLSLIPLVFALAQHTSVPVVTSWNEKAAADYLDRRETWWLAWPKAQRDHGTACVSCHTAVPYALARPALDALSGGKPSRVEQTMLEHVTKRVHLWSDVEPFYTDAKVAPPKSIESRGTEAVLNALILANRDSYTGHLGDDTKLAFNAMWAQQLKAGDKAGAWNWLNFHNAPWESNESQYWGAALAAVAIGKAPQSLPSDVAIRSNLRALRDYLRRDYPKQPLANQAALLWAMAKFPELVLTPSERSMLADSLFSKQQPDGGWSLTSLGTWKRRDNTELDKRSDGYATGLVVLALEDSSATKADDRVARGLKWLARNQNSKDGSWPGYSLNKQRNLFSDAAPFMTDAATAYAVMALRESEGYRQQAKPMSSASLSRH